MPVRATAVRHPLVCIWAGVALLIKLTRGRLGHDESMAAAPLATRLHQNGAPTKGPASDESAPDRAAVPA